VILVGAVVLLVGWQRPWSGSPVEREAARMGTSATPVTIVLRDRFEPEWLRIRAGGCVVVDNRSASRFQTPQGVVEPGARATLCFDRPGAHRVRLGPRPYSGGFVYVEAR